MFLQKGIFYKSELETIQFPTTLKEIKGSVFNNCTNLRRVELNEGLETLGAETNDNS